MKTPDFENLAMVMTNYMAIRSLASSVVSNWQCVGIHTIQMRLSLILSRVSEKTPSKMRSHKAVIGRLFIAGQGGEIKITRAIS